MPFAGLVALAAIVAVVILIIRGWDVRLVLLVAALAIGAAAGDVPAVVRKLLETFSDEKFVVPICAAMGFAYVLRLTGCDRHLVLLLVKPIRRVRWLLVPGVIAAGFIVNVPVISQTSTAVCLGAVVIPLMRAAAYSMPTIGATLLLGASVGGELLNPGAPELLTVFNKTGVDTTMQAHTYLPPLVFTQLAVSMIVFWALSMWWERQAHKTMPVASALVSEDPLPDRVNLLRALVPLVPLALLFAAGPPLHLIDIGAYWVTTKAETDPSYSTRLIGLAMLVGVLVAAAVTPSKARDCVKSFFEGAGYGFTHVISLIVTANCFGVAIEKAGLAQSLGSVIADTPRLMQPLSAVIPMAFAAISGSGMATTQSLYGFFHAPAVALGLDAVSVGALVSVASAAGRTMSPVAAVVLMCATLSGVNPFVLAKRVAGPLIIGLAVVVMARMAGLL